MIRLRFPTARLLRAATLAGLLAVIAGNGELTCQPAPVDCTGAECACVHAAEGLVITEIMPRSWKAFYCPEWFELYNPTAEDVDLTGWVLEDPTTGNGAGFFPDGPVARAGDSIVLAQSGSLGCMTSLRYSALYGGSPEPSASAFSLGLREGGIVLLDAERRVRDAVVWDRTWGFEPGRSLELVDPALDNSLRANWAPSTHLLGFGRPGSSGLLYGTPGQLPVVEPDPATPTCDDGNPCTVDYCLEGAGCTHVRAKAPCDDGDPCTLDGRCDWGVGGALCAGAPPRDCDDGDPCTADACDSRLEGGCHHLPLDVCDGAQPCAPDGPACPAPPSPCWAWTCGDEGRCTLVPTDDPCDDGDPCTVRDACEEGTCRGETPDRTIDCGPNVDTRIEGVCVPELGGVVYAVRCISDDIGCDVVPFEWCDAEHPCEPVDSPCGELACWEFTSQCVFVVR